MTYSPGIYATTTQFKARMGITNTTDDSTIGSALATASRAIDDHCSDSFYRDATATIRYFTATQPDRVEIDPVVSVTALVTDIAGLRAYATTWTATDYDLFPANIAEIGRPYRSLETRTGSTKVFPLYPMGVKLTAIYGWPAVPEQITEACLLWASHLYKRKDTPWGVAGAFEFGEMRVLKDIDPDVERLLLPFVRGHRGALTLQIQHTALQGAMKQMGRAR